MFDMQINCKNKDVTRTLISGGGGCIHILLFARQISFQIEKFEFDLKRNRRAEHENINTTPPINVLVTSLCKPQEHRMFYINRHVCVNILEPLLVSFR